jgi:hypothetical protein
MWRDADRRRVAARRLGRSVARPGPRARRETRWDDELATPLEVTTPDRESATALLDQAVAYFRAELVEAGGAAIVVRLHPAPAAPAGWVFEFLALIERWLDAHDLQVAKVHHGSRSYAITAPASGRRSHGDLEPASAA